MGNATDRSQHPKGGQGEADGNGRSPDAELESALRLLTEVAEDVKLAEGDSGVQRVLRSIARLSPAPTRLISRDTRLPVPVVAAVQNQLRVRSVLTRDRPSQLTANGRQLVVTLGLGSEPVDVLCDQCAGTRISIPAALMPVVDELAEIVATGPAADLSLDQSHATAATKVRRVLHMIEAGMLPTPALLAVGDDDLISVAIAKVGRALGTTLTRTIAVVDISPEILDAVQELTAGGGFAAELFRHDLRQPLPAEVRGRFTTAMTDPPYTTPGARLFLSRAIDGLRPGPGRDIYFHFGPKGPDAALEIDETLVELGLSTSSLLTNFNEYQGSGILGGVSHARHLVTTMRTRSVDANTPASGPLYTADIRQADREYNCRKCDARYLVGLAQQWKSIGMLKEQGCPSCGGFVFAPGRLAQWKS